MTMATMFNIHRTTKAQPKAFTTNIGLMASNSMCIALHSAAPWAFNGTINIELCGFI